MEFLLSDLFSDGIVEPPVGSAWLGSGGSPFLIVGAASLVQEAVLHSFAPGLQSGETPDLDPELVSLQSHYLWC